MKPEINQNCWQQFCRCRCRSCYTGNRYTPDTRMRQLQLICAVIYNHVMVCVALLFGCNTLLISAFHFYLFIYFICFLNFIGYHDITHPTHSNTVIGLQVGNEKRRVMLVLTYLPIAYPHRWINLAFFFKLYVYSSIPGITPSISHIIGIFISYMPLNHDYNGSSPTEPSLLANIFLLFCLSIGAFLPLFSLWNSRFNQFTPNLAGVGRNHIISCCYCPRCYSCRQAD